MRHVWSGMGLPQGRSEAYRMGRRSMGARPMHKNGLSSSCLGLASTNVGAGVSQGCGGFDYICGVFDQLGGAIGQIRAQTWGHLGICALGRPADTLRARAAARGESLNGAREVLERRASGNRAPPTPEQCSSGARSGARSGAARDRPSSFAGSNSAEAARRPTPLISRNVLRSAACG